MAEIIGEYFGGTIKFNLYAVDKMDYIGQQISEAGLMSYEKPSPSVFLSLAGFLGGTFFDVGANNGLYSLMVAAASPHCQIVAFEPLDAARHVLYSNLAENAKLSRNIRVESIALSDATGTSVFYETINEYGLLSTSSSLNREHAADAGRFTESIIETITLDDWMSLNPFVIPTFMKIDVEGHEKSLFEGARTTFRTFRPIILVELLNNSDFEYFAKFIKEYSYLDYAVTARGFEKLDSPSFVIDGWNHVLVPVERAPLMSAISRLENIPIL